MIHWYSICMIGKLPYSKIFKTPASFQTHETNRKNFLITIREETTTQLKTCIFLNAVQQIFINVSNGINLEYHYDYYVSISSVSTCHEKQIFYDSFSTEGVKCLIVCLRECMCVYFM